MFNFMTFDGSSEYCCDSIWISVADLIVGRLDIPDSFHLLPKKAKLAHCHYGHLCFRLHLQCVHSMLKPPFGCQRLDDKRLVVPANLNEYFFFIFPLFNFSPFFHFFSFFLFFRMFSIIGQHSKEFISKELSESL